MKNYKLLLNVFLLLLLSAKTYSQDKGFEQPVPGIVQELSIEENRSNCKHALGLAYSTSLNHGLVYKYYGNKFRGSIHGRYVQIPRDDFRRPKHLICGVTLYYAFFEHINDKLDKRVEYFLYQSNSLSHKDLDDQITVMVANEFGLGAEVSLFGDVIMWELKGGLLNDFDYPTTDLIPKDIKLSLSTALHLKF